jgi:hypothetical protein
VGISNQPPAADFLGDSSGQRLFDSSHHGTLNMSFVDGSIHKINFEIDAKAFEYFGNKSDGQTVDSTNY